MTSTDPGGTGPELAETFLGASFLASRTARRADGVLDVRCHCGAVVGAVVDVTAEAVFDGTPTASRTRPRLLWTTHYCDSRDDRITGHKGNRIIFDYVLLGFTAADGSTAPGAPVGSCSHHGRAEVSENRLMAAIRAGHSRLMLDKSDFQRKPTDTA